MIILDTNVLSALMREPPEPLVVAWLDDQPPGSVWTTSITAFEVRMGIELLTESRRRDQLEESFHRVLALGLRGQVLDFDQAAATESARLLADRQRAGRAIEYRDAQIAGIALSRQATLATRNTKHFREGGPALVDPWHAGSG